MESLVQVKHQATLEAMPETSQGIVPACIWVVHRGIRRLIAWESGRLGVPGHHVQFPHKSLVTLHLGAFSKGLAPF